MSIVVTCLLIEENKTVKEIRYTKYRCYDTTTERIEILKEGQLAYLIQHSDVFNARLIDNHIQVEGRLNFPIEYNFKRNKNSNSVVALNKFELGYIVVDKLGVKKILFETDRQIYNIKISNIDLFGNRMFSGNKLNYTDNIEGISKYKTRMAQTENIATMINIFKPWSINSNGVLYVEDNVNQPYDINLKELKSISKRNSLDKCRKFHIGERLKIIPNNTFKHGIIESFYGGVDLLYIGKFAFSETTNIKKLDLRKSKKLFKIDEKAFYKADGLEELFLSDNCEVEGEIECRNLRVLSLPKNAKQMRLLLGSFSTPNIKILILPEVKTDIIITEENKVYGNLGLKEIWTSPENIEQAKKIANHTKDNVQIKLVKRV